MEGDNEGVFEGLQAGTEYKLEVVDLSFANYAIYSKTVKTTGGSPEGYLHSLEQRKSLSSLLPQASSSHCYQR